MNNQMPLSKQNITVNFSQGLETKTDPFQIPIGKFSLLENSVFKVGGRLTKRNGYGVLPTLPDATSTFITTFNGDLTAIGNKFEALASGPGVWYDKGLIQPLTLNVLPLIRSNTNQSQADIAISSNNLICTVYTDQNISNLANPIYKYVVADATTGQNIIEPTIIANADPTYGTPKVFLLGFYFVIVYTFFTGSAYHLQYIAVSIANPINVTSPVDITTSYTPSTTVNFDAYEFNNSLYIAWNGAASSGVKMLFLTSQLVLSSTINPDPSHHPTLMSVTADAINSIVWVTYYTLGTTNGYSFAVNPQLASILGPTLVISTITLSNITSIAANGIMTFFYEVDNNYVYDSSIPTHTINANTLTQIGTLGTVYIVSRAVGLASKAFFVNGTIYILSVYQSPYQTTYFLMDLFGNVIAEIAYTNGGGYLVTGLPNAIVNGNEVQIPYLFKDLIQAVNKNTNVPSGSQVVGIYSQTGINLVNFTLGIAGIDSVNVLSAEIGTNLNLTGGFLWAYDGYVPTEQGFFLWPDSIELSAVTGGSMANATYFYQVTYEWTDNQGNAFRSAPSIPVSITLAGGNDSVIVHIPTLRLTYKRANPVKLVVYRWSTTQQIYYQSTSIFNPLLNSTIVDSLEFVDTNSDATILGNNVLYTTGNVVEDIGGPSFKSVFLFDDRLFGIKSEDPNVVMFSKQVIESTPVEMSDLFTIYVAPNIGAQGSTGPLICGSSMDDKAILFKATAINYFNGTGPDNTGANNQYSQPIFITSTVGCSNQKSIVFQPEGLMFEFASEAGNQIWLLGRDLSTQYIGAPVEALTQNATVQSAVNIPGSNQVRFTMSSGITLMYDYYYRQWGTFVNVPAISSTLYNGLHTYLNSLGQVFQETPNVYLDGSSPVLMSFTTGWINFNILQGYQRFYFFYLLGTYISPHKLVLNISYDYISYPTQQTTINPTNFAPTYGEFYNYGNGTPYGGPSDLEQWRIFLNLQRCQSFQINANELYDPQFGVVAGEGLSLSGLNCIVGFKKGYRPIRADHSVGSNGSH